MATLAIRSYDARSIRSAMTAARSEGRDGVKNRVPDTMNVIGGAGDVTLRRRTGCRVCGEAMPKGSTATQFAYRFYPDVHPYRITEAFIHPERCP